MPNASQTKSSFWMASLTAPKRPSPSSPKRGLIQATVLSWNGVYTRTISLFLPLDQIEEKRRREEALSYSSPNRFPLPASQFRRNIHLHQPGSQVLTERETRLLLSTSRSSKSQSPELLAPTRVQGPGCLRLPRWIPQRLSAPERSYFQDHTCHSSSR